LNVVLYALSPKTSIEGQPAIKAAIAG